MKQKTKSILKRNAIGYGFIAPLLIYFVIFQLAPMLIALIISFTNYSWEHLFDYEFVGFHNYWTLLGAQGNYSWFWSSLKTTFLYILITVPANIILTLAVSSLLNSKIKGEKFFKTVFYIPSVTVGVAIMVMWKQLLSSDGVINKLFGTNIDFLYNNNTALLVIALMSVWGGLGYNVLIMLSAMKNIDQSMYEAAEMDGAGAFKRFWYVTVPGVMPTVFFFLVMGLIGGFQVGEQMLIIYGVNDVYVDSMHTYVYQLYSIMRGDSDYGMASAMSYLLFLIILVFTLIQFRLQNGRSDRKRRVKNKEITANEGV